MTEAPVEFGGLKIASAGLQLTSVQDVTLSIAPNEELNTSRGTGPKFKRLGTPWRPVDLSTIRN
jgi:hypothetical protein